MFIATIAIIVGFAGLIWSADQFVAGAAGIAKSLGMAPVMIGLTIVSVGTSAPEIIVSINASMENSGEMAIGNALGSNLANIGLVLGVTALIAPIPIARRLARREIPLLMLATLGGAILLYDNNLGVIDGVILLATLVGIFTYLVSSKSHQPDAEHEVDIERIPELSRNKAWWLFAIGLLLLILCSRVLVWGAKDIAVAFGVSELVIGLTVIAVGTSLPELAATVASAVKGHHDIAIGNVVGSNLFNLLGVMAMPALISPTALEPHVFLRDYLSMTAMTLLLVAMTFTHLLWNHNLFRRSNHGGRPTDSQHSTQGHARLGRVEGGVLLLAYGAYYYLLIPAAG